jgi:bacteriocin biosynthesis cyclodehydratase domain-containing protein
MSRPPARRPTLLPALRRLWRDPHRLQLGTDPDRAVVLEFADPACAGVLDLLDGTRTEASLLREAWRHGITAEDTAAVLAALRGAGLVFDIHTLRPSRLTEATRHRLLPEVAAIALRPAAPTAPDAAATMHRRQSARILVTGAGSLVVPIASALASAGVGHIHPALRGVTRLTDVVPAGLLVADTEAQRPRTVAAAEAVLRIAPEANVTPLRPGRATFAVLVGFTGPATLAALAYGRRRLPHLAVAVRDGTVVVGPLVRPGVTPCLNCLDLHRLDRDAGWPAVAAQLGTAPETVDPVAATTALAGVAYAAAEVLAHLDGGSPTTLGATVELAGPGLPVRRQWTPHPSCGCRGRAKSGRARAPPALPGCFN